MNHAFRNWLRRALSPGEPQEVWAYGETEVEVLGTCITDQHDQCGLCRQPIPARTEAPLVNLIGDGEAFGWPLCAACWEDVRQRGSLLFAREEDAR